MNTTLLPNTIEKLTLLHTQFQQMMVLQLLLEWLGEPTVQEIETAFSSIANAPLSAETMPSLLRNQWVEQPYPQAPISLTLLGLKTLKHWQKTLSEQPSAKKPIPALAEEKTPLPPPPAFLIRSPKAPSPETKPVKKTKSLTAESLAVPSEEDLTEAQWQFYETLREARFHLAQKENIKAYRVCSNAVLRSLAVHQPTDYPALEQLHGIGRTFMEKYAPTFISLTAANVLK
ncbi:MAG: HRDC domain-containing protein [Candidatus Melainabacteria bacterium]|nr:HRDC domain-containing protein [Candidatus Melainabacteria bacterium]